MDIHRIYQGRVSSVERIFKDKNNAPIKDWQEKLFEHHSLYQDAVNYYILALACMADPEGSDDMAKARRVIKEKQEAFCTAASKISGLSISTLQEAEDKILFAPGTDKKCLRDALTLLVSKLSGSSAIQQNGRSYYPRLCDPNYSGGFDFSKEAIIADAGRAELASFLAKTTWPQQDLAQMAENAQLEWVAKVYPDKFFKNDEAITKLSGAITLLQKTLESPTNKAEKWLEAQPSSASSLMEALATIKGMDPSKLKIPRKKNAFPLLVSGFLWFKYFPSELSAKFLGQMVKPPKVSSDGTPQFSDDPIKLARGKRGYVFPAFTSFSLWGADASHIPTLKDYDIQAFKEALKTFNQFHVKSNDRRLLAKEAEDHANYIEKGGKASKLTTQGEDSPSLKTFSGDPRFQLLQKILTDTLAKESELAEGEMRSYTLRTRGLKGLKKITDQWNKILTTSGEMPVETISEKLKESLAKYQTENRYKMGSAAFFLELTKETYWPLWQTPSKDETKEQEKRNWTHQPIQLYATYLEEQETSERYRQPINISPAHPTASRRLFYFSDLSGKNKVLHRVGNPSVDVSLICYEGKIYRPVRVRLYYSAPRLARDGLLTPESVTPDKTDWLQPMMKGLGITSKGTQDFSTAAVALMPDLQRNGNFRTLLNFPVKVNTEYIQKALPRPPQLERQFYGKKDQLFRLHWPDTYSGEKTDFWMENFDHLRLLSVDIGTRGNAWAKIRVHSGNHEENDIELGSTNGNVWYAKCDHRGMFKLPGEDQKIWKRGKFIQEFHGERGRLSSDQEAEEAHTILKQFNVRDVEQFQFIGLSFPEQNDVLLRACRQARGRLRSMQRMYRLLLDGQRPNQWEQEIEGWIGKKPASSETGCEALVKIISQERERLPKLLLNITDRISPLRGRQWAWEVNPKNPKAHLLTPGVSCTTTRIRGQRGLSIKRIAQLEDLRKAWQTLNKIAMTKPEKKPEEGRRQKGQVLEDPCPMLLDKLNAIKDQRTNQMAHQIVAQALGVRLKQPTAKPTKNSAYDVHGEYEKIPGCEPVDFIVVEDLENFRTTQAQSRMENSRLTRWSHRALIEKLTLLCEPYGLKILKVQPAYSSRFCARTGMPGFRVEEITSRVIETNSFWRNVEKPGFKGANAQDRKAIVQALKEAKNKGLSPAFSLFTPREGGNIFISTDEKPQIMQADMNAAINIGLRAVAGPQCDQVHAKINAQWNGSQYKIKADQNPKYLSSRSSKLDFIEVKKMDDESKGKVRSFFFVPKHPQEYPSTGKATAEPDKRPLVRQAELSGWLRDIEWNIVHKLNAERCSAVGIAYIYAEDDLPWE